MGYKNPKIGDAIEPMIEQDQLHPEIGSASWKFEVPPQMIHGNFRLALYFDGSVGKVNQDNSRQ